MSKEKENDNGISKVKKVIMIILLVISLISSIFAIYEIYILSTIENTIRYIVMGVLALIDILLIFKTKKIFKKRKKAKKASLFITCMIIYSIICLAVGGIIFYLYGKLSNMNKGTVTYSSSLVVMSKSDVNNSSDIKNLSIGLLSDKNSPDGYIISQEIIKDNNLNDDNEIKNYDDYSSMITDLYLSEIDAVFLPTDYVSMFSNLSGYENIATDTKIVVSKEKKMKKAATSKVETESSGKDITQPFTMLLMGIDSTDEVLAKNAVANGDTLILITFNPKTLNATMLSIPRDSYVPIACWPSKAENKITHAAGYGNDCMMNTIENYLDINIDYYAKINFKGLVKLVDAVGGVDINVEQQLCTDDSSRGSEICINPGYQTLNGEQALVYARNRKALVNGDFGRNQHQQEIIMALANKVKTINSVGKFNDILNTVSNSLDTNLTPKQMLSFYNIGKDIMKKSLSSDEVNIVNIQQLYLSGTSQMIYDERMRMVLYDYVPNKLSRDDIVKAMKENLGLEESEIIKEFSFSINQPYEKEIIGKGPYKTSNAYNLLPSFIGDSEATARAKASRYGISVTFTGGNGTVIAQSYPANKRIDMIKGSVVLTLADNSKSNTTDKDKNTNKNTDKDKDTDKDKNTDKDTDTDKDANTDKDKDKDKDTDKEADKNTDKDTDTSTKES